MSGSPTQSLCHDGGATVAKSNLKDRISTLPDEILCFILSFLTTKEAVAASVLSKRWSPLWRSVPAVDLDYDGYYTGSSEDYYVPYVVRVNSVTLHLHHPIHKFRLCCFSLFSDPADFTRWVNAAVQRRVRHLDLSLDLSELTINLSSIFTCRTLVVLKLLGDFTLEHIPSINLPLLKVMHLQRMTFSEFSELKGSSVFLPSLQVLSLLDLTFSERGCLAELLSGSGCPVLEDFGESNLRFQIDERVSATRFKTLPKLLRADISIVNTRIMLGVVNNVKFLRIHNIKGRIVEDRDPFIFPTFHNLTHIELQYWWDDNGLDDNDWSEVVELLKHCPKLQVLVIGQVYFLLSDPSKKSECPPISHLKRCPEEELSKHTTCTRYIREDSKENDNMQWRWNKSIGKAFGVRIFFVWASIDCRF